MCGIVHIKRFDGRKANKMLCKRYQAQKTRGQEGFGYVSIDDNYLTNFAKTATEKDIMEAIDKESANEILFHHRYPTSTPNLAECAHPIVVNHSDLQYVYFVIHNGIIQNDYELKAEHEKLGYKYTTQIETVTTAISGKEIFRDVEWNDSEALAIELAMDIDKAKAGIKKVRGSIAFIVLQADRVTRKAVNLFFGRNYESPLSVDYIKDQYLAITSVGKGEILEAHKLNCFNYESEEITNIAYDVGERYSVSVNKYGYRREEDYYDGYFMGKEWDDDPTNPASHRRSVGFNSIPTIGASKSPAETTIGDIEGIKKELKNDEAYDKYYDAYWNFLENRNDVIEILDQWKNGEDGDETDRAWYESELDRLNQELEPYGEKTATIKSA